MRRCGVCRGIGHNRATCPSSGKPAKVQTQATSISPDYTASGRRKASCSFCLRREFKLDRTHTVRTCEKRIAAREEWIEENSLWCFKQRADMMAIGFGPGAIIECDEVVYVIEKIDFEVFAFTRKNGYICTRLDEGETDRRWGPRTWRLPYPGANSDVDNGEIKVLSPIPPEMVERAYPKNWDYGNYAMPMYLRNSSEKK